MESQHSSLAGWATMPRWVERSRTTKRARAANFMINLLERRASSREIYKNTKQASAVCEWEIEEEGERLEAGGKKDKTSCTICFALTLLEV
jgi:hypothetical protein